MQSVCRYSDIFKMSDRNAVLERSTGGNTEIGIKAVKVSVLQRNCNSILGRMFSGC